MFPPGPLIAHRGASAHVPENTLAALSKAAEMGCRWVEVDVQVARDGGAVLMHDHTVDRTTEGSGAVAMITAAEVMGLRTRTPSGNGLTDEHPPSLEQALELCRDLDLGMVLEIKATWGIDNDDARRVAALLPSPAPAGLVVTSFSVEALRAFRQARPEVKLGLACLRVPRDPAETARALGLSAIHCNAAYTDRNDIARAREAGLDVAIATVNDGSLARRFLDDGVDGVMTDDPRLLGPIGKAA